MKRMMVISVFVLLAVGTASAQSFDLDWDTIDGGGAMWTTGGSFELSGTIGQPDAGVVMTGGGFELTGGFWPGAAAGAAVLTGDLNCDGLVNSFDIDPFVLALTSPAAYALAYPECNIMAADVNCDGLINAFDIDPFVLCLTGGGCPPCP
jgi:hypothetical protein